jgi:enoyl-CoA hydratase
MQASPKSGTSEMLARVEDGVGWMTYNNPDRHNAVTLDMQRAIPGILDAFQADPDVRVIVITGAGEKAFVSGADISEFGAHRTSVEARAEFDAVSGRAWQAWQQVEKPILAMIRGYCIGGGLATAMQADIRIAAEDSLFGIPAARLGIGYRIEFLEPLVALVGPAWAAEILYTARRLSADEAHRIGLVNRVVPVSELAAQVQDLARAIASNAPMTIRASKVALRELQRQPAARNVDLVRELTEACFRSDDYVEGQRAFLEKRTPRFQGR